MCVYFWENQIITADKLKMGQTGGVSELHGERKSSTTSTCHPQEMEDLNPQVFKDNYWHYHLSLSKASP